MPKSIEELKKLSNEERQYYSDAVELIDEMMNSIGPEFEESFAVVGEVFGAFCDDYVQYFQPDEYDIADVKIGQDSVNNLADCKLDEILLSEQRSGKNVKPIIDHYLDRTVGKDREEENRKFKQALADFNAFLDLGWDIKKLCGEDIVPKTPEQIKALAKAEAVPVEPAPGEPVPVEAVPGEPARDDQPRTIEQLKKLSDEERQYYSDAFTHINDMLNEIGPEFEEVFGGPDEVINVFIGAFDKYFQPGEYGIEETDINQDAVDDLADIKLDEMLLSVRTSGKNTKPIIDHYLDRSSDKYKEEDSRVIKQALVDFNAFLNLGWDTKKLCGEEFVPKTPEQIKALVKAEAVPAEPAKENADKKVEEIRTGSAENKTNEKADGTRVISAADLHKKIMGENKKSASNEKIVPKKQNHLVFDDNLVKALEIFHDRTEGARGRWTDSKQYDAFVKSVKDLVETARTLSQRRINIGFNQETAEKEYTDALEKVRKSAAKYQEYKWDTRTPGSRSEKGKKVLNNDDRIKLLLTDEILLGKYPIFAAGQQKDARKNEEKAFLVINEDFPKYAQNLETDISAARANLKGNQAELLQKFKNAVTGIRLLSTDILNRCYSTDFKNERANKLYAEKVKAAKDIAREFRKSVLKEHYNVKDYSKMGLGKDQLEALNLADTFLTNRHPLSMAEKQWENYKSEHKVPGQKMNQQNSL